MGRELVVLVVKVMVEPELLLVVEAMTGLVVIVGVPGVAVGVAGVVVASGVVQEAAPEVAGGGTGPAVVAGPAEGGIYMGFAAKRRGR